MAAPQPLKRGSMGNTSRFYRLAPSTDDVSILIPAGTVAYAIKKNAQALKFELHTAARVVDSDGSSIIDSARSIDASADEPMRPCKPGEYLNISHSDGSTGIGAFELVLEGDGLPSGASNLTTSDPGA